MQISGSLKRKTIDFYRENINFYAEDCFCADNISFFYDGVIRSNNEKALHDRQEVLILNGIDNTLKKACARDINSALVAIELEAIKKTPRNMSYALFECFYRLVVTATSSDDFKLKAYKFAEFREYLCSLNSFNQWELDIMISLFENGLPYKADDLKVQEEKIFGLRKGDYDFFFDSLVNFGKFVAPHRVGNVAKDIKSFNILNIDYIAFIYFALKRDDQAELFKKWCMTQTCLDFDSIINKAMLCKVPEPIIKLVREIEEQKSLPF